jgi:hypothetical protein
LQANLFAGAADAAARVYRTGSATIWPLVVRAQQPAKPVVGLLHGASQETFAANVAAFKQGLSQTGCVEGHNGQMVDMISCLRWPPISFGDKLPSLPLRVMPLQRWPPNTAAWTDA